MSNISCINNLHKGDVVEFILPFDKFSYKMLFERIDDLNRIFDSTNDRYCYTHEVLRIIKASK